MGEAGRVRLDEGRGIHRKKRREKREERSEKERRERETGSLPVEI